MAQEKLIGSLRIDINKVAKDMNQIKSQMKKDSKILQDFLKIKAEIKIKDGELKKVKKELADLTSQFKSFSQGTTAGTTAVAQGVQALANGLKSVGKETVVATSKTKELITTQKGLNKAGQATTVTSQGGVVTKTSTVTNDKDREAARLYKELEFSQTRINNLKRQGMQFSKNALLSSEKEKAIAAEKVQLEKIKNTIVTKGLTSKEKENALNLKQLRTEHDIGIEEKKQLAYTESKKRSLLNLHMILQKLVNVTIYTTGYYIYNAFVTGIKDAVTFTNDLNKAMTNVQMITGRSSSNVNQLTKDYSELASSLHETTLSIMEAAEEFLRAGNTAEDTGKLLQASTVMSKIAGNSQEEAAQSMIAIMNSYKLSASDMMSVADKMVAVDNASATSTAELTVAIQKSAAAAQSSGVSFEQLISYLGTVSSVSRQSAEIVGTSFNTMFSRYENVKSGATTDDNGEAINDVEKILNKQKISIRDSKNEFISFNDVLNKLSAKWKDLSGVEKAQIATSMAGVRQRNSFLILLNNMNMALGMQKTQAESAGNAMERYAIYGESTEAKMNDLTNTLQKMWMSILNSDQINAFVSSLNYVASTFGNLQTVIVVVTSALLLLTSKSIMTGFFNIGASVAKAGNVFSALGKSLTEYSTSALTARAINVRMADSLYTTQLQSYKTAGAFRTLGFSIKELFLSNPIGWIALIATVAMGVADVIGRTSEDAKNKIEEINGTIDKLKENKATFDSLYKQYESLSSKVSLSTDEYKQLLDVQTQLAELSEDLVLGYDAEGNAILKNTAYLKEYIQNQNIMIANEAKKQTEAYATDLSNIHIESPLGGRLQSAIPGMSNSTEELERYMNLLNSGKTMEARNMLENLSKTQALAFLDFEKSSKAFAKDVTGLSASVYEYADLPSVLKKAVDRTVKLKFNLSEFSRFKFLTGKGAGDYVNEITDYTTKLAEAFNSPSVQTAFDNFSKDQGEKTKKALINAMKKILPEEKNLSEIIDKLFPDQKTSVEAEGILTGINAAATEYIKTLDSLSDAYGKVRQGQKLNGSTLLDLIKEYPLVAKYISKTNDLTLNRGKILEEVFNIKKKTFLEELKQDKIGLASVLKKDQKTLDSAKSLNTKLLTINYGVFRALQYSADEKAAQKAVNASKKALAEAQATINAIGKINIGDIDTSTNLGSSSSKSSPSAIERDDMSDLYVKAYNAQVEIDKVKGKSLETQIKTAKAQGDYNKELSLTNKLLANQQKTVNDLEKANQKISNRAKQLREQNSKYNTSKWFDINGEATTSYEKLVNSFAGKTDKKSKAEQDRIKDLFKNLQALKKAYSENRISIVEFNDAIAQTRTDKVAIKMEVFEKSVEKLSNKMKDLDYAFKMLEYSGGSFAKKQSIILQQMSLQQKIITKYSVELSALRANTKHVGMTTAEYNDTIRSLTDSLHDAEITLEEFKMAMIDLGVSIKESKKNLQDQIIEYLKSDYTKEYNLRKEALDKQFNLEVDDLNRKKELMKKAKDEENYIENQQTKYSELESMQARYNKILLDPTAGKERSSLLKQIATKEKEIKDEQVDHNMDAITAEIDAEIEAKTNAHEKITEENEKLYREFIAEGANFQTEMLKVWADGQTGIIDFLKSHSDEYRAAGLASKQAFLEGWQEDTSGLVGSNNLVSGTETVATNTTPGTYDTEVSPSIYNTTGNEARTAFASADRTKVWMYNKDTNEFIQIIYDESRIARLATSGYLPATWAQVLPVKGVNAVFDSGGLAKGIGTIYKNTIKPELMLSPTQTEIFGRFTSVLTKLPNLQSASSLSSMLAGSKNSVFNFGDININVDTLESDADYKQMANKSLDSIRNQLAWAGNGSVITRR